MAFINRLYCEVELYHSYTVLEKRHDIVKLSRVCRGWILVFKEFPGKI